MQIKSIDLPRDSKRGTVLDADGNPLIVSGVVVFQVVDTLVLPLNKKNMNEAEADEQTEKKKTGQKRDE